MPLEQSTLQHNVFVCVCEVYKGGEVVCDQTWHSVGL